MSTSRDRGLDNQDPPELAQMQEQVNAKLK